MAFRRELYPHEMLSAVNFAALAADLDETEAIIVERLLEDRRVALDLLETDLQRFPTVAAISLRIIELDLGLDRLESMPTLLASAEALHRETLQQAAELAAVRVRAEARSQGMVVSGSPPPLSAAEMDVIELQAMRLAQGPHVELVRALREQAASLPLPAMTPDEYRSALLRHGAGLSEKPLEDYARTATTESYGVGRTAGASALPEPARIYASELLDSNTCGPCSMVDGKEYDSVAESLEDYPNGRYINCDGGSRCRGTRVFVWDEEPASQQVPGDRPRR